MKMIDVFRSCLLDGMEISNIKELQSKTKFSLSYNGMTEKNCEIGNVCSPGSEKEFCIKAINTIVSGMYINIGDLQTAKKWLRGEMYVRNEGIEFKEVYEIYKQILKSDNVKIIDDIEDINIAKAVIKLLVSDIQHIRIETLIKNCNYNEELDTK